MRATSDMGLTPTQSRAARALLGWSQEQLAEASLVSAMSVRRFERGEPVRGVLVAAMRRTMEDAGVRLLGPGSLCDGEAVEVGVALRRPPRGGGS